MDLHFTLCQGIEAFGAYDQVDLANLAGIEHAYRKLQLIEHFWEERGNDQAAKDSRLPPEEMTAFAGGARPAAMICPELLDHVSKELERISGIKKNARKLREEANLRKTAPKGGKEGG